MLCTLVYATCVFRFYEILLPKRALSVCETRVERLLCACSTCLARPGSNTNVLQHFEIFVSPAHVSVRRLCVTAKASIRDKLFLYVQNLKHVESIHTPDARLGYTLMCDCLGEGGGG